MYLVVIYPQAQAPEYERPTSPIKAYMMSADLRTILDRGEGPYGQDKELEHVLEPLLARYPGFKRDFHNTEYVQTFERGLQRLRQSVRMQTILTPEKAEELLAMLAQPRKIATPEEIEAAKPQVEELKRKLEDFRKRDEELALEEEAIILEEFEGQL